MGRLSGITYRILTKRLRALGFEFWRSAKGRHEIWYNETLDVFTTIPRHHGDMAEGTVRAILKQATIEVEDFLRL